MRIFRENLNNGWLPILTLLLVFGLSGTASAQSSEQFVERSAPLAFAGGGPTLSEIATVPSLTVTPFNPPSAPSFGPAGGGSSEMQTPPVVVLPSDSLLWDKSDALMASEAVNRFEVCLDATPCISVTPAASKQPAPNPLGTYQWKLPAVTVGPHTVKVRACNTDLCSADASLDIKLAISVSAVGGLRAGPGK